MQEIACNAHRDTKRPSRRCSNKMAPPVVNIDLADKEAWDDTALIRAYDRAIRSYENAHAPADQTATSNGGSHKYASRIDAVARGEQEDDDDEDDEDDEEDYEDEDDESAAAREEAEAEEQAAAKAQAEAMAAAEAEAAEAARQQAWAQYYAQMQAWQTSTPAPAQRSSNDNGAPSAGALPATQPWSPSHASTAAAGCAAPAPA